MGMLYEYEGFRENTRGERMFTDLQYRIVDGKKVLYKFVPTTIDHVYNIDEKGYIYLDLSKFSWQPVETIED